MRPHRPLRSYLAALCGLASILGAAHARAPSRPAFAGIWGRMDSTTTAVTVATSGDAAAQPGDMGSGWGAPLVLTVLYAPQSVRGARRAGHAVDPLTGRFCSADERDRVQGWPMVWHGVDP